MFPAIVLFFTNHTEFLLILDIFWGLSQPVVPLSKSRWISRVFDMCFFRRRSDAWKRFEMERRYYLRFSRWAIRRKALELHHGFSGFPTEVEKNPEDHSDPLWVFPSISFGTTIKLEEVVIFFVKPNVKGDLLRQRSSSSRFLVPDGVGWFLNVSGPPPSHTISCHTLSYIMSFWYVTPIYIYQYHTVIPFTVI